MSFPDKRKAVGHYASAVRYNKPYIHAAARDLAAAQIADYIEKTLKGPLPLTPEQRAHISALLNGGATA